MFRTATQKSKPSHSVMGFIPEFGHVLLRDNQTGKLELWTRSLGIVSQAVILDGHELEFVREVQSACRVVDNEFNQKYCPNDIGRIYVDGSPSRAYTVEIK